MTLLLALEHFISSYKGSIRKGKMELPDNELINYVQESIENGGEKRSYHNIRQHIIQKGKPYIFNSVRLAIKSIDPYDVAKRLKLRKLQFLFCNGPC